MATYVIGDIQGCFVEFELLLDRLNFESGRDQLWLVGDLVNRGPNSLQVLELVKSLGESAVTLLGNHDLHLLAIYYAGHSQKRSDTLSEVLEAEHVDELMNWLKAQRLFYRDSGQNACMSHAGIPHIWSIAQAEKYAIEVEHYIQASTQTYFSQMYGNLPDLWNESLNGMARIRCITNYLARMRFIDESGRLDLETKGPIGTQPDGYRAWFELRQTSNTDIYFGHWASLEGKAGPGVYALDTGCVWGKTLTARCIETVKETNVHAVQRNS